jgi:hypothetical protein
MKQLKVIYIAGPYRAPTEWLVMQNICRAEDAALFVWQNGGVALCPHKNSAHFGGALNESTDDVWLRGGLELMHRCDAVWLIHGWQDSSGSCAEKAQAMRWQMPILESEDDVLKFLGYKKSVLTSISSQGTVTDVSDNDLYAFPIHF